MSHSDVALRHLEEALLKGRLCPVLGAGASVDLGIPLWGPLLKELAKKLMIIDSDEAGEKLLRDHDLPHLFDLLRQEGELTTEIRHVLYTKVKRSSTGRDPAIRALAVLTCLSALVAPNREFHALTYNMDTLLEEEICALGHNVVAFVEPSTKKWAQWRSTAKLEVWSRARRMYKRRVTVKVYHPHGYVLNQSSAGQIHLPADWKKVQPGKVDGVVGEGIVMGRRDYNELFRAATDPRNLRQLAAFLQHNCLFYGFSFLDPNVDGLLDLASQMVNSTSRSSSGSPKDFRHVALLKAPEEINQVRPDIDTLKNPAVELDVREEHRLRRFGILRSGHSSYEQHFRIVIELIRRSATQLGCRWPGSYNYSATRAFTTSP